MTRTAEPFIRDRARNALVSTKTFAPSVRQVRVGDCVGGRSTPVSSMIPSLGERHHVGKADPTMPTARQTLRGDLAGIEEPGHERARQSQELANFGWRELGIGGKHRHGVSFGQLSR